MRLNLSRFNWVLPKKNEKPNKLMAGGKYSPAFLRLLNQNGIQNNKDIEEIVNQNPTIFHDPFLLYDMDRTIDRISEAINSQENILIYGDYDADGITSTLIMYEAIEGLGGIVEYYLPDRFKDGYGPNLQKYKEFIEQGTQLIITCDNGVAGHEAISYAMQHSVDVIVTDHHELQATLPEAYSIIHPRHPRGSYPFSELCGAGVALKVVSALLNEIPMEAVELAMIGTIADMVSLTDENRTIVINGLLSIKNTQRIGLHYLFNNSNIDIQSITAENIGFILAPKLNSTGRISDPSIGFKLLLTVDESEAEELAEEIEELNNRRKAMTESIYKEVVEELTKNKILPNIIIQSNTEWHPGILGIVASRIMNEFHRPTILFYQDLDKNEYKGSGRSIDNIDLFQLLLTQKSKLKYFGGHAQAAGMTVEGVNWDDFIKDLKFEADKFKDKLNQPLNKEISLEVKLSEISLQLLDEINLLGPFGIDNEKPLILISNVEVKQIKYIGTEQQHLKIILMDENIELSAIGFSLSSYYQNINAHQKISIIGYLDINEWNNQRKCQLQIVDIGIQGSLWVDKRSSKVDQELLKEKDTLYLFNTKKILNYYSNFIDDTSKSVLYSDCLSVDNISNYNNLFIFQCPSSLKDLKVFIEYQEWSKIYLSSYNSEPKYIIGVPSRDEIIKFYLWIKEVKEYNLRNNIDQISSVLFLSKTKIKLIIRMFLEANFVTISDSWLKFNEVSIDKKVNLKNLSAYKEYIDNMEVEELLNYKSIDTISSYFERED